MAFVIVPRLPSFSTEFIAKVPINIYLVYVAKMTISACKGVHGSLLDKLVSRRGEYIHGELSRCVINIRYNTWFSEQ